MRDRVLLGVAIVLLVGGLSAWAIVGSGAPNDDRALYLASTDPPPPIGDRPRDGDTRARSTRAALELVGLTSGNVREIAERAAVPLYGIAVPGRDAVAAYEVLAAARPRTDLTPVLLGDGHAVARHVEAMRTTLDPPAAIIRRAALLDVDAWARARLATEPVTPGARREPTGDARDRFPAIGDPLLGLPLYEIGILLVPTTTSAEVIAWLAFGNWRGCPEPTTHVAVLGRLEALAGAEVVAVSADRIDLRVSRIPAGADERRAVAELLAAYAPSVRTRPSGTPRTLEDVAAEIVPSRVWSLRWPRP